MIIARSEHLSQALDRRDALRINVRRLEAFQSRAVQIAAAASRIAPLAAACRLLRERGVPVPRAGELIDGVAGHVESLRRAYHENRSDFIDPRKVDLRRISTILGDSCASLESAILTTWKAYVDQRTPPTSNEILAVLARIPAYASQVAEIRQGAAQLAILIEQVPTKEDDFAAVEGVITRIRNAWESLDTSALSEPVLAFLRACARPEGAPLTLLTGDVQRWVEEQGLAKDFRVRVGGTS